MRSLGRLALAAAVLAGAATACDGSGSTAPAAPPTARFHATLLQYRPDEGSNRLEVELTNVGTRAVTVSAVQIRWPGVRGAPRTPKDTTYAPKQVIDLTTTYGTAVCDGSATGEPPHALVTLRDGRVLDLTIDRHGSAMLGRFHADDCARQRFSRAASVRLDTSFSPVHVHGRRYLEGDLILRRGGSDAPVALTALTGSVLLTFGSAPGHRLPSTVLDGVAVERFPVLIGSTYRCDDHGLSQSTQTYLLSAYFRVGAGPQTRIILVPGPAIRARAQHLMRVACR